MANTVVLKPYLVFVDLQMPMMCGAEVLQKLAGSVAELRLQKRIERVCRLIPVPSCS